MATPQLTVTIQSSDREIMVSYRFENRSDEPVLVFCRHSGRHGVDPKLACQEIEGWRPALTPADDMPQLIITKAVIALKPGHRIYVPNVPLALRVEPGDELSEEIVESLPVVHYNPHNPFGYDLGLSRVTCRQVAFRLGYAPVAELDPPPRPLGDQLWRVDMNAALAAQRLLTSELEPGTFPVKLL